MNGGNLTAENASVAGSVNIEAGEVYFADGKIDSSLNVKGGKVTSDNTSVAGSLTVKKGALVFSGGNIGSDVTVNGGNLTAEDTSVAGSVNIEKGEVSFADGKIDSSLNVKGGNLTAENTSVAGSVSIEKGEVSFSKGTISGDISVSDGTLEIQDCTISKDLNVSGGTVRLKNCTINGNINYDGGSLVLEGDFALEGSIKIAAGMKVGIKNLAASKNIKISGTTETEEWNVGTEVIYSTDGTALSDLICSKFSVKNKDSGGKSLCVVPSSTDATKGVLSVAGASVVPSFGQPEYTLTLSPASFIPGNADNKVSLAVTDSAGNSVTPDSVEFVLYQNKNKVAALKNGLIPSWIPEGKYTVIATAKVGVYSYDVETNIIISENIAISSLTSAPSASDFPKITASSSQELVTLNQWVNAGSDLEGITITLVDDIDLADCLDWQPIGFIKSAVASDSDSDNMPFRGTFNGNGKTISYEIKKREDGLASQVFGLFFDNYGTIENLVVNQTYSGDLSDRMLSRGGMICAYNYGNIKNCIVKADIAIGSKSDTAGICKVNTESGKVVNCFVTGNIENQLHAGWEGSYQKTAGICCINYGTVENAVSSVQIKTKYVTENSTQLSNISGAIAARTDGYLKNCYWLKDNINQGGTVENHIAYINKTSGTYTGEICIPDPSRITGCGYFETNSPSASVTAGTTSECKSAQTLAYNGTLIEMLNAYVSASSDSGLKRWTADYSGKLTLDF